jgi:hypothetical protein
MAQYRAGQYAAALATLTRAEQLSAAASPSLRPANLAFLAMTQHRLGNQEQARATLERLREWLQHPYWAKDDESQDFLREAEAVLAGKQTEPGK